MSNYSRIKKIKPLTERERSRVITNYRELGEYIIRAAQPRRYVDYTRLKREIGTSRGRMAAAKRYGLNYKPKFYTTMGETERAQSYQVVRDDGGKIIGTLSTPGAGETISERQAADISAYKAEKAEADYKAQVEAGIKDAGEQFVTDTYKLRGIGPYAKTEPVNKALIPVVAYDIVSRQPVGRGDRPAAVYYAPYYGAVAKPQYSTLTPDVWEKVKPTPTLKERAIEKGKAGLAWIDTQNKIAGAKLKPSFNILFDTEFNAYTPQARANPVYMAAQGAEKEFIKGLQEKPITNAALFGAGFIAGGITNTLPKSGTGSLVIKTLGSIAGGWYIGSKTAETIKAPGAEAKGRVLGSTARELMFLYLGGAAFRKIEYPKTYENIKVSKTTRGIKGTTTQDVTNYKGAIKQGRYTYYVSGANTETYKFDLNTGRYLAENSARYKITTYKYSYIDQLKRLFGGSGRLQYVESATLKARGLSSLVKSGEATVKLTETEALFKNKIIRTTDAISVYGGRDYMAGTEASFINNKLSSYGGFSSQKLFEAQAPGTGQLEIWKTKSAAGPVIKNIQLTPDYSLYPPPSEPIARAGARGSGNLLSSLYGPSNELKLSQLTASVTKPVTTPASINSLATASITATLPQTIAAGALVLPLLSQKPAVKANPTPQPVIKNIAASGLKRAFTSLNTSITVTKPKITPQFKSISKPVIKPATTFKSISKPVTEPVTKTITQPILKPVIEPITEPVTEPVTETITRPALPKIPNIPPSSPPYAPPPFGAFPGAAGRKVEGYNVYMYEFKKRVKANTKPLPYERAVELGRDIADNTLSASYRVTRARVKVPQGIRPPAGSSPGAFKFTTGKSAKRRFYFVEKPGYRLDTIGEKRGIKAAQYIAQKNKSIFGGF